MNFNVKEYMLCFHELFVEIYLLCMNIYLFMYANTYDSTQTIIITVLGICHMV
jgi:hypothetical protein